MSPVGRIDGDEDGADLGGGELGNHPLGIVGRPDSHVVALADAQGHESPGHPVAFLPELAPSVAHVPVDVDEGVSVAESPRLPVEEFAHGYLQVVRSGHKLLQRGV